MLILGILICLSAVALAQGIPYPVDSSEYAEFKQSLIGTIPSDVYSANRFTGNMPTISFQKQSRNGLLVPWDQSFTLALAGSDDGYTNAIELPFTFDFYGTSHGHIYINNNGNISFGSPYSTFTPTGFPIDEFPMLAAFWADVDTRPAASGKVWYKIESNRVVVIWNGVGYYSNQTDKLNTFEVILTNGSDPLIGIGNNVAFSYGDMQWTTGSASGGSNGFGGTPATVGLNKGDGINYALIGRFDHEGTDYHGPHGSPGGVSYLDYQLYTFNTLLGNSIPPIFLGVPTAPINLRDGESIELTINVVSSVATNNVNATIIHDFDSGFEYQVTSGNPCVIHIFVNANEDNSGSHQIVIMAEDDGEPSLSSQASFTINIYSFDEYVIAANYSTRDISVINTSNNEVFGPFLTGLLGQGELLDIVISPDSQFALISNFSDYTVYHLNISNPLEPSVIASYRLNFAAEDITLSYDGRYAIVADGGNTTMLAVIDLISRATVQQINISPHYAQGVALSVDGKVLVNDYPNNMVHQYLFNYDTGQLAYSGVSVPVSGVLNTSISPSGEFAILCGSNQSSTMLVRLNPDNTITVMQTLDIPGTQSAIYSPDGSILVIGLIGTSPNSARIYNVLPDGNLSHISSHNLSSQASGGFYGVDVAVITSDNSKVYFGNMSSDSMVNYVAMIDRNTGTISQISTGSPTGLALGSFRLQAQFTYEFPSAIYNTMVQFRQYSTGSPDTYLWDFGDGNYSSEPNPLHTYAAPGQYLVSLSVWKGTRMSQTSQLIDVLSNDNIVFSLAGSPYYIDSNFEIDADQILTIENGVIINFASGTGLTVHGTFNIQGATLSGNQSTGWNGILLAAGAIPVAFNNVSMLNAINGLTIDNLSFTINNLLISQSEGLSTEQAMVLIGNCNPIFNGLIIENYSNAIIIQNDNSRITSTPELTNIRVRNSTGGLRPQSSGVRISGSVAARIHDAIIEEYDTGLKYLASGIEYDRTTPVLSNIRIRNTSGSVRTPQVGMLLDGLERVIVANDSIVGYPTGLEMNYLDLNARVNATPLLTNIRVRNTSGSVREDGIGILLRGNISAEMDNVDIDDFSTGMILQNTYAGTEVRDTTTPLLTNIRVRNTTGSVREESSGIIFEGSINPSLSSVIIEDYTEGLLFNNSSRNLRETFSPVLTNIRVRNTSGSVRSTGTGIVFRGALNADLNDVEINEYGTGIIFKNNLDHATIRETLSPVLTNIRVRNTSGSVREDAYGIVFDGPVNATMDYIEIEEFNYGISFNNSSNRDLRDSTTPLLTNIRVRNTSGSVRSESYGIKLMGANNAQMQNVELDDYNTGILISHTDESRETITPLLTNIRVRNTSGSVRTDDTGINVQGSIAMTLIDASIDDYSTGLIYNGINVSDQRTTPLLTNIRIRNTTGSVRNAQNGMIISGLAQFIAENDSIIGYPNGLEINYTDPNLREAATPLLTNIRVRNTSGSVREDGFGIALNGPISAEITDVEILNTANGVVFDNRTPGRNLRESASPLLTNIRVRNTSGAVRAIGNAIALYGEISASLDDIEIENYSTGVSIHNLEPRSRESSSPLLTNIRVRNTTGSVRSLTKAVEIIGAVEASIDELDVYDYVYGIDYQAGSDQSRTRTTPLISNIRIRNTTGSVRETPIGIRLANLPDVDLHTNVIYAVGSNNDRNTVSGNAIVLDNVGNATIQNNTIWGFDTGLDATTAGNVSFANSMLWADTPNGLSNPILGDVQVSGSNVSMTQGLYPGANNYNRDPLFVDPPKGDFYLKYRSSFKDQTIGALPFDFDYLAATHQFTMHQGWNLMGVPYTPPANQNTPVAIFADDLNPFYVSSTLTSIVQMNQIAGSDSLGHYRLNWTGGYSTPQRVFPGIGYWVNNANPPTVIDIYGLMDDGDFVIQVPGSASQNSGWYMLANPYDVPIRWNNGLSREGIIPQTAFIYNHSSSSYPAVDIFDSNTFIPPWSGFYIKSNDPNGKIRFSYPNAVPPPAYVPAPDPITQRAAPQEESRSWSLNLAAKHDKGSSIVFLGANSQSNDGYDSQDMLGLPYSPFVLPTPLRMIVPNNDWQDFPGEYIRDIKAIDATSWEWQIDLDLANWDYANYSVGEILIAVESMRNIPAGYNVTLTNMLNGQSVDPRTHSLIINLSDLAINSEGMLGTRNRQTGFVNQIPLQIRVSGLATEHEYTGQALISTSNYPNPFNPETRISYTLGIDSHVNLEIYNLKGQKVDSLVNGTQNAGTHSTIWKGIDSRGSKVSSGIYFYRLKVGSQTVTKKILLSK